MKKCHFGKSVHPPTTRTSAAGWYGVDGSNDGKGAGDDNDDYGDDDEMKK